MERDNIIDYILNEGNKTRRRRNNNRRRRYPNHNKKNDLSEASATTRSKLGGDRSTTTGGTGSILFARIWTDIEYENTVNTNIHTNDETVQVVDVIYSDSDRDEGSKCDMEDSAFVVDD